MSASPVSAIYPVKVKDGSIINNVKRWSFMAKRTESSSALSPEEKKAKRSAQKVANFKKLATRRVNKAMNALASVAQLSNRNSYTYDQEQVTKIFTALNGALKSVADSFTSTGGGSAGFTL